MRNMDVKEVKMAVSKLCIQSCCDLPDEVITTMQNATINEESPLGKEILEIIMKNAKTGKDGTFGDGRIFISPVEEAYTISTGTAGL